MPTTYAIPNGRTVMDATLYTGTGTTLTVNNTDSGTTGFKPDMIWWKSRSGAYNHAIQDSVRGLNNIIFPNLTNGEGNYPNSLDSFNSNGFTLGSNSGYPVSNNNGSTYVAWQWQAGQGNTVVNTTGSISANVSASTTAGFSVVTYSGTGAAGTIGHGLGAVPKFIVVKSRVAGTGGNGYWMVYHASLGNTQYMVMQTNDAAASSSGVWNNTTPTSSVFSIGTSGDVSGSGGTFVAYCWAEVAGYSAFGSYTGNGSTNGPFIYLGFRPKYVMIKRTDSSAGRWDISDTSRNPYNYVTQWLYANYSDAEDNAGELYDFLSNGFKLRNNGSGTNGSGGTFIYMAWAENPFKYANAR